MKKLTEKVKRRNLKRAKKVDRRLRELNRMKKREINEALAKANDKADAQLSTAFDRLSPLQGGTPPDGTWIWWGLMLGLFLVASVVVALWCWLG